MWRERSDFIIAAETPGGGDTGIEQLWARRLGERQFELCCIPFFVYDLALGDAVETDADLIVRRVVQPSGRYVFRVWFGESFHPRNQIADALRALDSLVEWSSLNLLAVDAVDVNQAKLIADFLHEREQDGMLTYETGRR